MGGSGGTMEGRGKGGGGGRAGKGRMGEKPLPLSHQGSHRCCPPATGQPNVEDERHGVNYRTSSTYSIMAITVDLVVYYYSYF